MTRCGGPFFKEGGFLHRQLGEAQQQVAAHKRQLQEATSQAAGAQATSAELASLKVSAL